MSLFNQLMGRNPHSPNLLGCLGITQQTMHMYPIGRIRDVYTNEAADRIFILHRNYGEDGEPYVRAMSKHPNYLSNNQASPDDGTYWIYEFSVPEDEEIRDFVKTVAAITDTVPPFERYKSLIADMQSGKKTPMTAHAIEVGRRVLAPLVEAMQDPNSPQSKVIFVDGERPEVRNDDIPPAKAS